MKRRNLEILLFVAALLLPVFGAAQAGSKTLHATGTFEVKIKPAENSPNGKSAGLGTMTIDKVWSGGIEGTSKGEMLSTAESGAMAYVALEKVTAKVDGRSGTFVFMHRATMMANDPQSGAMDIAVMPNSGTGELAGLQGRLSIVIDKGAHSYDFAYTLPEK